MNNEETNDFGPGWQTLGNNTNFTKMSDIEKSFIYRSELDLSGTTYWSVRTLYSGGGYIANLGNTQEEALEMADEIDKKEWIDRFTAAIFIEINVYNANSGLFNLVVLAVEFLPTGQCRIETKVENVVLYRYNAAVGVFALLTELACLLYVIVLTCLEIRNLVKQGKKYFSSIWNIMQLVMVACFLVALSMYAIRSVYTQRIITEMMNNKGEMHVYMLTNCLSFY